MDGRGVCVSEGRTGWELVVVSMEDDVLKVSVTRMKSGGYSSPCVAGINLEHGQQGYIAATAWGETNQGLMINSD